MPQTAKPIATNHYSSHKSLVGATHPLIPSIGHFESHDTSTCPWGEYKTLEGLKGPEVLKTEHGQLRASGAADTSANEQPEAWYPEQSL